MSIKVANMIDFDTLQKLPKNVRDLCKLIVAKGFKKFPKSNKSPNLVTLHTNNTLRCVHIRVEDEIVTVCQ